MAKTNKLVLFEGIGGKFTMTLNDEAKIEATVDSSGSASSNDVAVARGVTGDTDVKMSKKAALKFNVGSTDTEDSTDDKDKGDNVTMNVTGNVNVGGDLNMNDKSSKEDFRGAAIDTVNKGTVNSTAQNCTTSISAQKK